MYNAGVCTSMIKIRVKLFAIYRDALGTESLDIELESGSRVKDLLERLSSMSKRFREVTTFEEPVVLVNGVTRDLDYELQNGDEVALIPTPSGGSCRFRTYFFNRDDNVNLDEILHRVRTESDGSVGALVFFVGIVKGLVNGFNVHELVYEVYHPYAEKRLCEIAEDVARKYGVTTVEIAHKEGAAKPGEKTVVIAVAADSREKAFKAAEEILERIKFEVPIFKLEKRSDGEYWVIGDGRRVKRDGYQPIHSGT